MNIFKNIKVHLVILFWDCRLFWFWQSDFCNLPGNRRGIENKLDFWWHLRDINKTCKWRNYPLFTAPVPYLYFSVSIYLSVCPGVYLPICLSFINQSINQSVYLQHSYLKETSGTKIYSPAAQSFSNQIASPPGLCGSSRAADGTAHPSAFQGVAGNGRSNGGTWWEVSFGKVFS